MKQLNPDVEEVLVTSEQIVTRAEELGQIITKKYKDKNPILIGLLKGAVPFMA
ncbi:MAG: hypoxanthine phosphoribosyltransferase, partial [Bacilli bacterium]